jgi:dTDP-4-amino-4,6-dideoxygalactose transaminase
MNDRLAIDGGRPLRGQPYPAWPRWDEREEAVLLDVLQSGDWWAVGGSHVKRLEEEFAAYHGAAYGVAVTNGSAALEVSLMAAGVDWGDEVITSPYTFIATASSCLLVGAVPRFADVLPDTWNLDPAQVEAAITPRTKAIIAVHLGGEPADMDALGEVARRHGLLLIEDACQAHGASWRGRRVGAIGDIGCFSFQASKNITGGEGGMILTNDPTWYERCWSVHNVGRQREGQWYGHVALASNYRLSEWAGAVLRVQLTRLHEQAERRARNGAFLADALDEVPGLAAVPGDARVTRNAYHLFKMWYEPSLFGDRPKAEFAQAMQREGIPISVGYPRPLSREPVIRDRVAFIAGRLGLEEPTEEECAVTGDICARGLWLPQNVLLGSQSDVEDVMRAALKVQRSWA